MSEAYSVALLENGYVFAKSIGRGQFGSACLVTLATAPESCFVVKLVQLDILSESDRRLAQQEVEVLRSLDHPHVVKFRESFAIGSVLAIVVDFCEAGDLRYLIKQVASKGESFNEEQIMCWFAQLVDALAYVHSKRILHRDLKTSNIFLSGPQACNALLGDFGISRVFEGSLDVAVTVVGTPYYMSPEVCQSEPYQFKSDIWSLGCVLCEMATLKHAFHSDNLLSLVNKIVHDEPSRVSDRYSAEVQRIIDWCLSKNAENRPTAAELLADPFLAKFRNFGGFPRKRIVPTPPAAHQTRTEPSSRILDPLKTPSAESTSNASLTEELFEILLAKLRRSFALQKISWVFAFAQKDATQSGVLSSSDFVDMLLGLGVGVSLEEAAAIAAHSEFSTDRVTAERFRAALDAVSPQASMAEGWAKERLMGAGEGLAQALRVADNGSRFIAQEEFKSVVIQSKQGLNKRDLEKFIVLAKKSPAGAIDYEDFIDRFIRPTRLGALDNPSAKVAVTPRKATPLLPDEIKRKPGNDNGPRIAILWKKIDRQLSRSGTSLRKFLLPFAERSNPAVSPFNEMLSPRALAVALGTFCLGLVPSEVIEVVKHLVALKEREPSTGRENSDGLPVLYAGLDQFSNKRIFSFKDVESRHSFQADEDLKVSLGTEVCQSILAAITRLDHPSWLEESTFRKIASDSAAWLSGDAVEELILSRTIRCFDGAIDLEDLISRLGGGKPITSNQAVPAIPSLVTDETFAALALRLLLRLEELGGLDQSAILKLIERRGVVERSAFVSSLSFGAFGFSAQDAEFLARRIFQDSTTSCVKIQRFIDSVRSPPLFKIASAQLKWLRSQLPATITINWIAMDSAEEFAKRLSALGIVDPAKQNAISMFCDKNRDGAFLSGWFLSRFVRVRPLFLEFLGD